MFESGFGVQQVIYAQKHILYIHPYFLRLLSSQASLIPISSSG